MVFLKLEWPLMNTAYTLKRSHWMGGDRLESKRSEMH